VPNHSIASVSMVYIHICLCFGGVLFKLCLTCSIYCGYFTCAKLHYKVRKDSGGVSCSIFLLLDGLLEKEEFKRQRCSQASSFRGIPCSFAEFCIHPYSKQRSDLNI